MHIIKTNNKSRKITLLVAGVVVLLAAGTYAAYATYTWPFDTRQEVSNTSEEATNNSDSTNPGQKKDTPSTETQTDVDDNKTTDQVPVAETGALTITSLKQENGNITYAASLQNVDTPGTCSALFEHSDGAARPVTRTGASTSDGCPEMSIPEVEFNALGTWKLTLRYYVNDTQLVATKSVEIK
jgi:cytoskeletal protein RodZ